MAPWKRIHLQRYEAYLEGLKGLQIIIPPPHLYRSYLPAAVEVVEVESHLLVVMSASDLLQHRPTLEELKIIVMVEMFFLHRHLHGNVSFLLERLELGLCLAVLEDTPMSPLVSLARFVGPLTLIRAGLDCCGSFLKDARSTRASSRRTILFLHISHM